MTSSIRKTTRRNGTPGPATTLKTEENFRVRAAEAYTIYANRFKRRFRWLASHHFVGKLGRDLTTDAAILRDLLGQFGQWQATNDAKLSALEKMLVTQHPERKVLVFTQFADTVRYLEKELKARGVPRLEAVTGDTPDPTQLAWRFSPRSNEKRDRISVEEELRVLIATDVLSEGQNLQDCAIVVKLRPAVGHYPPDSASRPRRPHRAAGTRHPLFFLPARRRHRASDPAPRPRPDASPRERRGGGNGRGVLRG